MEKAPFLVLGKGCCSNAECPHAGEETHSDHVFHGDLGAPHATALFDAFQEVLDKGVHALAQALEHDECQWDPQDRVEHAKGLPRVRPWGSMSVTWEGGWKHRTVSRAGDGHGSPVMQAMQIALMPQPDPQLQGHCSHTIFPYLLTHTPCMK